MLNEKMKASNRAKERALATTRTQTKLINTYKQKMSEISKEKLNIIDKHENISQNEKPQ